MKSHISATAGAILMLHFSIINFGQVITPQESKQSQFLWAFENCAAIGPTTIACDSVFQQIARIPGHVGLALCYRSLPILREIPKAGLDSLQESANILSSHNYLRAGMNTFVVSSELVPSDWMNNDWWLVIDGEEIELTLDSPITRFVSIESEATAVGIKSTGTGDTVSCNILLPIFPSEACVEPDLPPWQGENELDPWWIGCFLNGQPIEGQVFLKIGSDNEFNRPLIFLQGFDPGLSNHFPSFGFGDFNWDVIWECGPFEDYGIPGLTEFMNDLLEDGFDLVFLDLENGVQSVENQSALTQEVIRLCRDHKVGDESMVVVGPSLGGIVGRHALRMMELNEEPHCTRLFASIDSPFKGAWLPTALQEAIGFFSDFSVEAYNLGLALQSPAAGQMLIHSPFHSASVRQSLENLQDDWGLPSTPMCIATSNGNPFVETMASNDLIFHATESFLGYDYVDISLYTHPGSTTHENSTPENLVIFNAEILNSEWSLGEPLSYSHTAWSGANLPSWNALPGSYSNHLSAFQSALELSGIEADYCANQSLFIPTLSALDLALNAEFSTNATPFNDVSFEPASTGSAFHCDLTSHLDFLNDWIIDGKPLTNSNAASFQHAYLGWAFPQKKFIGTFDLAPLGTLEVGTAEANGSGEWPIFDSYISTCGGTVSIGAGGQMLIGDSIDGGNATLTMLDGARLILNEGSSLHIGRNSSVIMAANSIIELNGGKIVVHPEGIFSQEANSQVILNGSGEVQLCGVQSLWKSGGDLLLLGQDTLNITGTYELGMGTWNWVGNQVYSFIGEHAKLDINHDGDEFCNIIIPENSGHLFQGTGLIKFQKTNFYLSEASTIRIQTRSQLNDCTFSGTDLTSLVELQGRTNWVGGSMNNMHLFAVCPGVASFKGESIITQNVWIETQGNGTRMNGFEFHDSQVSVTNPFPLSWIQNCIFDGGLLHELPLFSIKNSNHPFRCESTNFSNHNRGIEIESATVDLGCSEFENMVEAMHLKMDGVVNMMPPNGKNHFHDNAVHFKLSDAPIPHLISGNNWIGPCTDASILGTSPLETTDSGGSLLLSLTGNFWPNAQIGVPLIVPSTDVQSSLDGGSIQFKDMLPHLSSCLSDDISEDANVKIKGNLLPAEESSSLSVFPNPVHQWLTIDSFTNQGNNEVSMDVRLMNALGRKVFECKMDHGDSKTVNVESFANGWYALEISSHHQAPQIFQLLIQHP